MSDDFESFGAAPTPGPGQTPAPTPATGPGGRTARIVGGFIGAIAAAFGGGYYAPRLIGHHEELPAGSPPAAVAAITSLGRAEKDIQELRGRQAQQEEQINSIKLRLQTVENEVERITDLEREKKR